MEAVLEKDFKRLRAEVSKGRSEVNVTISAETASVLADLIEARAKGQDLLPTRGLQEVTPAEAAALLGMSRPMVRKLLDSGKLPFRMVGTHYRILASDVDEYLAGERIRRRQALKEYSSLQDELGLEY